jgi:hypothetical protein
VNLTPESPDDWTGAADELTGAGVTRLGRDKLALVLAGLADRPRARCAQSVLGYATVARIAEATNRLELAATG